MHYTGTDLLEHFVRLHDVDHNDTSTSYILCPSILSPLRSRRLCSSSSAPIAADTKVRGPSVSSVVLKWQGTQQHGEAGAHDELVGARTRIRRRSVWSVVLKSVCSVVLK